MPKSEALFCLSWCTSINCTITQHHRVLCFVPSFRNGVSGVGLTEWQTGEFRCFLQQTSVMSHSVPEGQKSSSSLAVWLWFRFLIRFLLNCCMGVWGCSL
jgi:hypothetical protein